VVSAGDGYPMLRLAIVAADQAVIDRPAVIGCAQNVSLEIFPMRWLLIHMSDATAD
jgi:hypothetical protein